MSASPAPCPFVSRAGLKLDHALREFQFSVAGMVCADFGCNIGGFTDCLLQRGASKVFAIDTGYGTLAYKLRTDSRVVVMERTNALHAKPPTPAHGFATQPANTSDAESTENPAAKSARKSPEHSNGSDSSGKNPGAVDLVVIDMAWTPQRHAIPAALQWLKPTGRIISLVKPHYELTDHERSTLLIDGRLDSTEAQRVLQRVLNDMPALGAKPLAHTQSPITGGKSSKGRHGAGNVEFLVLLEPL